MPRNQEVKRRLTTFALSVTVYLRLVGDDQDSVVSLQPISSPHPSHPLFLPLIENLYRIVYKIGVQTIVRTSGASANE